MGARLGQHFLADTSYIRHIIDALRPQSGDTIIEIGPGTGTLTTELESRIRNLRPENQRPATRLVAVEKDNQLVRSLREKFKDQKNVEIVEGDILKVFASPSDFSFLNSGRYKVVGNIPYYITGRLLRVIGELQPRPEQAVLMVQREVAERLSARPPQMNLLAASVQVWAEPEIVARVPKTAFRPAPKVESAIVCLRTRIGADSEAVLRDYYNAVRALFRQPRKTILNNLLAGFPLGRDATPENLARRREQFSELIVRAGGDPLARPQTLAVTNIRKLSILLKSVI